MRYRLHRDGADFLCSLSRPPKQMGYMEVRNAESIALLHDRVPDTYNGLCREEVVKPRKGYVV